jgi:signal transduction histidine kinase
MSVLTLAPEQLDSLPGVASIVHDLRNPLSTIHGSAEMLARSTLSQSQVRRIARNMYCASVRMRELLEEFLDQSRGAEKEAEPCQVGELVTCAVDKIAISAEFQSVGIVREVPEDLEITAVRPRIYRVLVNLLVNALEAMPTGGIIHISAVTGSNSVVIKVRDTGPGIAPEIRSRLFQPFATAGKANGIGLGLAFSRQAVVAQGGDMWAEPSSQGACLAFRLPSAMQPKLAVSC